MAKALRNHFETFAKSAALILSLAGCHPMARTPAVVGAVVGSSNLQPSQVTTYQTPDVQTATTQNAIPGYDVIIIGGQSNAVGVGRGPYSDPLKSDATDGRIFQVGRTIHYYAADGSESASTCTNDEGKIIPAGDDTLEHWYNCPGQGSAGFGMAFARRWVVRNLSPGRSVLIVPGAMGGTTINQWVNSAVHNPHGVNLLNDLTSKVQFALNQTGPNGEAYTNRVVAMLWSQGEGDLVSCATFNPSNQVSDYCNYSNSDYVANQWAAKTVSLFQEMRTRFNDASGDFPILATGYVPTMTSWQIGSSFYDLTGQIQFFQDELKNIVPWYNAFQYVDTANLGSNADIQNYLTGVAADYLFDEAHVHFNGASQILLGDRRYNAFDLAWTSKIRQTLLSTAIFDWQSYLALNPDLQAAGITTQQMAEQHWIDYGSAEGRQANGVFDVKRYLALYPQVASSCNNNYVCAEINYVWYGVAAQMWAVPLQTTFGGTLPSTTGLPGDAIIGNPLLKVTTSSKYAGAIDQLVWGGKQFVNNVDHGRQMQVSAFNNGLGECDNPTEAGSSADGNANSTTSQIIGVAANSSALSTQVSPAYWTPPDRTSPFCSISSGPRPTSSVASGEMTFSKKIELSTFGDWRIFKMTLQVAVGRPLNQMTLNAMNANLSSDFSSTYYYNPATGLLTYANGNLTADPTVSAILRTTSTNPVIQATPDGSYALAMVAPVVNGVAPQYPVQITHFNVPGQPEADTANPNVQFAFGSMTPSNINVKVYFVVGSLTQVQQLLQQHYADMMAGH